MDARFLFKLLWAAAVSGTPAEHTIDPDPAYPWIWLKRFGLMRFVGWVKWEGETQWDEMVTETTRFGFIVARWLSPLNERSLHTLAWGKAATAARWPEE